PAAVMSCPTARLLAAGLVDGSVVETVDLDPDQPFAPGDEDGEGRRERVVPASPTQEAAVRLAPTSADRGILSWVYQLNGTLHVDALAEAFDEVVARHEVLRTRVEWRGHDLVQVVTPFRPGVLEIASVLPGPEGHPLDVALARTRALHRDLPIVGLQGLRAILHHVGHRRHVLSVFFSEALVDGASTVRVAAEIERSYAARTGHPAPDPGWARSTASYVDHVRDHPVPTAVRWRAECHWRSLGRPGPMLGSWPTTTDEKPSYWSGRMTADEWAVVGGTARLLRSTPYVVVLAALEVALARVAGACDYLVTGTVHHRHLAGTASMIGCFDSMVWIEAGVEPATPLSVAVESVGRAVRDATAASAIPAVVATSDEGEPGGAGIVFSMFEARPGLALPGVRQRRFRLSEARDALRLTCTSLPGGERALFLSSATAPPDLLAVLADEVRAALTAPDAEAVTA
ncbi:MAG TPA: condensation domain-containing protein, partial [Iamia sp.]|nr:condensation domain-containing protein [Iamia sp.]